MNVDKCINEWYYLVNQQNTMAMTKTDPAKAFNRELGAVEARQTSGQDLIPSELGAPKIFE